MPHHYDIIIVGAGHNGLTCPGPGVSMAPGRNAAHVIFGDLGLDFSSVTRNSRETLSPA